MQDRYAGNVGDFGKYALLNQICIADGRETATKADDGEQRSQTDK